MRFEDISSLDSKESLASNEQERPGVTFEQIISQIDRTDVTVYEKLNATNMKAARDEFLSDSSLMRPNNIYDNLDPLEVSENLAALDSVESELTNNDIISDKQKRYIDIILNDHRRANDFLAANLAYNSARTPAEKAEAATYHHEANEAYYGKPDEDTFYTLLQEKIDNIHPEELRPEDKAVYQSLIEAIGPMKQTERHRFKPRPETVARFSEIIQDFFEEPLSHIPKDQKTFTPDEAASIVNKLISEEFGDDETRYRAKVQPERANASVDPVARSLTFPGSRPNGDYTRDELETIIVHEFGTHIYRAAVYENHPLVALSRGLPGNEDWDEGVAKCVEQAIAGKYQDSGIDHYINIGLATFKDKNFREVFNISTMLKFLSGSKPNETDEARAERLAKIRNSSFNQVQRCFRGTGELVNNKDLAYYNGANQVWQYIEENIDDPELMDRLFIDGKTVAINQDQSRLIYETHVGGL